MWNDGPAKQPWLNYFNEYELQHCCFGGDGGNDSGSSDIGAAGDIAASTSGVAQGISTGTNTAAPEAASGDQSRESYSEAMGAGIGTGMSYQDAKAVGDAIDAAEKAGASNTQMQNIAEGGNRAAQAGYTGEKYGGPDTISDLQVVAAANKDINFFDETDKGPGTRGVGSGSISGYGSFADPFAESGVGQTSFKSFSEDFTSTLGGALETLADAGKGMMGMTPSGLALGMLTGTGPGGGITRDYIGDYKAPLAGLAGLSRSKKEIDPEFEAIAAKNAEYEKTRQDAEAAKNMGNITDEEYMDIIDEINKSKSSITGPSGLEGFGGPTSADYEAAYQAAARADMEDYEGIRGPGSHSFEVGDPTYDPDRVDLGPMISGDKAGISSITNANKNPNEIDEEGYYGILGDVMAREAAAKEAAAKEAAAKHAKAIEEQRVGDINFVAPDPPALSAVARAKNTLDRAVTGLNKREDRVRGRGLDIDWVDPARLSAAARAQNTLDRVATGLNIREDRVRGGRNQTADRKANITAGIQQTMPALKGKPTATKTVIDTLPTDHLNTLAKMGAKIRAKQAALGEAERAKYQKHFKYHGGLIKREGGGTAEEDNEPFEYSMSDYFKKQKTAPFYSTTPNPYLVALQQQIYPDLNTEEIYRRLGYRDPPDSDDTSAASSYGIVV